MCIRDRLEPALAHARRQSLRQLCHEIGEVRHAHGLLHVGVARAGATEADVLEQGVVEEHGVLRHDPDRLVQRGLRHRADVLAVDPDRAGLDVVEAEEEPPDGGLARARRADQRHPIAGFHLEADAVQDLALGLKGAKAPALTVPELDVRAAVLDGAVDPTVGYLQQNIQQAAGFEATFATFLAQCSAAPMCAFYNGGNAEGAYDQLAEEIDAAPISVDPARTAVTQGVLTTAVADAMYDQGYWPQLEQALADLQAGDGQGILDLYDDYYGYYGAEWDDSLEAYFAIGCLDDPGSTGPDDLYSHEAEFAAAAPRLGRGWMAELTFCSVWPVPPAPTLAITGEGAGPIMVVGTTGDPATPLQSTRNMATALEDGHLVIVTADQHTGYGVNGCVNGTVDAYLVDPTAPLGDEITCD